MRINTMPSPAVLVDNFNYCPVSGNLTRKKANCNRVKIGEIAGHITKDGYRAAMCEGKRYFAHRIAWKIYYGTEPEQIDHIDGNPLNNKIDNLRSVTHRQNGLNQKLHKNNKSGCSGVSWSSAAGKWRAYIKIKGVQKYLGVFENKQDAISARLKAEKKCGYHENHGNKGERNAIIP